MKETTERDNNIIRLTCWRQMQIAKSGEVSNIPRSIFAWCCPLSVFLLRSRSSCSYVYMGFELNISQHSLPLIVSAFIDKSWKLITYIAFQVRFCQVMTSTFHVLCYKLLLGNAPLYLSPAWRFMCLAREYSNLSPVTDFGENANSISGTHQRRDGWQPLREALIC